ncbi:MAG: PD40 domain-containing protein [Verrucomicrobia bacterium]|nr:PD40 domain-containing protein [Verrucomicrobiota bacterium]
MFSLPIRRLAILSLLSAFCVSLRAAEANGTIHGRIDAHLMRQPDVSATQIAFVYAGDIWVAPKSGGTAVRLSSPRGEEMFPRFSPDGSLIAFSGNYDGNTDIYVMPASGGLPKRITHHGASDRVVGWYPDGKHILFASQMTSPRNRFNQLWKISAEGGLPERLPIPYGEFGAISPDGTTLAYTPISVDFRTWKRYRGGMNPDIWFFDLEKGTAKNITNDDAADAQPMWHGTILYFLSDRDASRRANIWAYDTRAAKFRQITFFKDFDVHFPSIGPDAIVFENAGQLHLLDLATEKSHAIEITVVTDRATLKPHVENVSKLIQNGDLSPTGKRAVFEARGEIFTVPAENGVVRNLTRTSGAAERYPAWSPDGKWIAYFTDRTGEYELAIRPSDGTGEEQVLTKLGGGYRFTPQWAPDSKKLVFIDKAMKVQLFDLATKVTTVVGQQLWMYHGELRDFRVSWSTDSRWLTYAGDLENRHSAIMLYDVKAAKRHQVTSGFYDDDQPAFVPGGQYLFYRSGRAFNAIYSDLDNTWIYPNSQVLVVAPLRKDVPSPLAPKNDEEPLKKDDEKKPEPKKDEKKPASGEVIVVGSPGTDRGIETETAPPTRVQSEGKAKEKSAAKTSAPSPNANSTDSPTNGPAASTNASATLVIDLDGFEQRGVILPTKHGRYDNLTAVKGKLLFRWLPRAGSDTETSSIEFWDIDDRKAKRVLDDASGFSVSANGQKLLVARKGEWFILDVKEGAVLGKKLATDKLEAIVDPVAEWKQIFTDAWRIERDFLYDPALHGVDWKKMRERYGKLLEDAVTRWDVNYLIGELISELNASHTYHGGGDLEAATTRGVGYLGCDFALEDGAYRIKQIVNGAPWDISVRSPLKQPGANVKEGDYLLAVNGIPMDTSKDPWAAFQGLGKQTVALSVNSKPELKGAREIFVETLDDEQPLRYRAWIEANRLRVDKLSGGKIGYIYVPDTTTVGQTDLVRQFRAQFTKPGLIVDERFNSGGQIPDRFVELLGRGVQNFWGVRDGEDWQWPQIAHAGPKAMLMNGWSGSGGDCFPYYFKQRGLGPLIGARTWGGLIGITGAPPLIDGGHVTVPTFGIYNNKGEWIIEGYGVDPDIAVVDDPAKMAKGGDPQLERAVAEVMKSLKNKPPMPAKKPPYPKRAGN